MNNSYERFEYKSYEEYIASQMKHSETKSRTQNRPFSQYRDRLKSDFPDILKILCVGSRDVSEVKSLKNFGYDAIGIDLFSDNAEFIKILDMHFIEKEFSEKEFDLIYSCHSLEHSYDPERVMSGMKKVSKIGAFIILPVVKVARSKDPIKFTFMKKYTEKQDMKNEHLISLIEEDFESLGAPCKVINLEIKPEEEFWISLIWK